MKGPRQERRVLAAGSREINLRAIEIERDHLLAVADRHIAEGERIVASQRRIVEEMRRSGMDTTTAVSTLSTFLHSLDSFYSHRDLILRRMGEGENAE